MHRTRKGLAGVLTIAVALVGAGGAAGDATERVVNGGFEAGSGTSADSWTFSGSQACDAGSCGLAAADGSRYAATSVLPETVPPGNPSYDLGSFTQTLVLPEAPATLKLKYRAEQSTASFSEEIYITLNGTPVATIDRSSFTSSWQSFSVAIPAGSVSSSSQVLDIDVLCSNTGGFTINCDRVDVDDVSIITGAVPDPVTVTGTDPASPSTSTHPMVKGTVGSGSPSQIQVFSNGTCAGSPAATGTAADFTGPGIGFDVPANSTTSISAKATNLAGDSVCSNAISYVSTSASGTPGGGNPGSGNNPTPPPDTTAPFIGNYRVAPSVFRAAKKGGSVARSHPIGAKVQFALSEAASVTFTVQRFMPGRRVGRKCAAPTKSNKKGKPCKRLVQLRGTLVRTGAAGANAFGFTGRWAGKALPVGSYRLGAVATDAAGNKSLPAYAGFTIVPR